MGVKGEAMLPAVPLGSRYHKKKKETVLIAMNKLEYQIRII